MPVFEFETPNGRYQFDAPDQATALQAASTALGIKVGGGDEERPASFADRFGTGPMARDERSGPLYDQLRARADERLIGESSGSNAALAAGLRFSNSLGLNAPRNAAAGLATAAGKLGVSGFNPSFEENYRLAKDQEEALARQNPKSAIAGDVAGIGVGMVMLPAMSGAATLGGRMGQAAVTGAGYGAAGEALDTKDLGRAATAGVIGGVVGAAAQPLAEKAVSVVSGLMAKGMPWRNEDGTLTATTKTMLKRVGVDPDTVNSQQLDAAVESTIGRKGPSEATAREAAAGEFGIPLSRGQATGDAAQLKLEQELAAGQRGTKAKDAAGEFFEGQGAAINAARDDIGARLAGGESRVGSPLEAAELVAQRARQAAGEATTAEQQATAEADRALAALRGSGDEYDAAALVTQGVRDRAGAAKAGYRQAYDEVAQIPGEFERGALDRLGTRVRDRLGPTVPIDEVTTPMATRALADLDNLPALFRTEDGRGPDLGQLDQVRKRLVSYYGAARQNPTDQRAIKRVLDEFDQHAEDAMAAGLFGPRQAPLAASADDFPGAASIRGEGGQVAPPSGREREPESLIRFLGREGGIALDGDARAADLGRIQTGYGPLGRQNGRSLDDFRPRLIEEGFLSPDRDGGMARNIGDEVHELIRRERAGDPVYRIQDRDRAAGIDRGGRAAGADEHFADLVSRERGRIVADHEAVGLRARDLDPDALREASESLVRGHHSDPFEAYEAAVMGRAAGGKPGTVPDIPFDGATARATSDVLPGGTTAPSEAMKKARGAFSDYQRTFKPQGSGDDIGRAMQRIVERDAQPTEVASMLYGGNRVGNTGLSVRLAERLKSTLGTDSAEWGAVQQGLVNRILGPNREHAALSQRIDEALTGPSRKLIYNVLTDEHVAALRSFQSAVRTARTAREAVPDWVADLGKAGFEPSKVVDNLFGRTTTTSNVAAMQYARGLKAMFGEKSPEWAAIRQAGWQKITGEIGMGPAEMAKRIRDFVDGKGKALAASLYSAEEIGLMRRFAAQIQVAVPPATAKGLGKEETLRQAIARKGPQAALNALIAAIGYSVGGPVAAGSAITANIGRKLLEDARNVALVRKFAKGAPVVKPEPEPWTTDYKAGTAAGLVAARAYYAGQSPCRSLWRRKGQKPIADSRAATKRC